MSMNNKIVLKNGAVFALACVPDMESRTVLGSYRSIMVLYFAPDETNMADIKDAFCNPENTGEILLRQDGQEYPYTNYTTLLLVGEQVMEIPSEDDMPQYVVCLTVQLAQVSEAEAERYALLEDLTLLGIPMGADAHDMAFALRQTMDIAGALIPESSAAECALLYREWQLGTDYKKDERVRYAGLLYSAARGILHRKGGSRPRPIPFGWCWMYSTRAQRTTLSPRCTAWCTTRISITPKKMCCTCARATVKCRCTTCPASL